MCNYDAMNFRLCRVTLLIFPFLFNNVLFERDGREQDIGKALLPTSTNSDKALPAPTETVPELATASATKQKAEVTPEIVETVQKAEATPPDVISETKVEAAAEPAPEINSVPKTETVAESIPVQAAAEPAPEINSVPKTETVAESIPVQPKPLSPYPYVMSYSVALSNFSPPIFLQLFFVLYSNFASFL